MSPREAGFKGSEEIFFAVIATTVALVAVFFPIRFFAGNNGEAVPGIQYCNYRGGDYIFFCRFDIYAYDFDQIADQKCHR